MGLLDNEKEQAAIELCRQRKAENIQLKAENKRLKERLEWLNNELGLTPQKEEIKIIPLVEERCAEPEPQDEVKKELPKIPPEIDKHSDKAVTNSKDKLTRFDTTLIAILLIVSISLIIFTFSITIPYTTGDWNSNPPLPTTPVIPTAVGPYNEWSMKVPVDKIGDSICIENALIYDNNMNYLDSEILFTFKDTGILHVYGEGYTKGLSGTSYHVYQVWSYGFSYDHYKYVYVYGVVDDANLKYMKNLAGVR